MGNERTQVLKTLPTVGSLSRPCPNSRDVARLGRSPRAAPDPLTSRHVVRGSAGARHKTSLIPGWSPPAQREPYAHDPESPRR